MTLTNTLIQDIDTNRLRVIDGVDIISGHVEQTVLVQYRLVNHARIFVEAVVANVGDQISGRIQNETRLGVAVRLHVLEHERSREHVHVDDLARVGTKQVVVGTIVVLATYYRCFLFFCFKLFYMICFEILSIDR